MKGSEFIRKIKKLAKAKNISVRLDKKRGKGSHITLYFGDRVLMHLLFIGNQQDRSASHDNY